MSFLDNFDFAFQEIILESKKYNIWKYWEKIEAWFIEKKIKWVIQAIKNFSELNYWKSKNTIYTSKDYEMRTNIDIEAKKWDIIRSFGNEYTVIYTERVILEGIHDHNLAIIRLI